MKASSLENVPEFIICEGRGRGSWPNISGAKFECTVDHPYYRGYRYTFNNMRNNKVSFYVELYGQEFEFLQSFVIIKTTTKK
jgi:hypothetical protein